MTPTTPRIDVVSFERRREHLEQRRQRGWVEDEDVAVCLDEIDRLTEQSAEARKQGAAAERERLRGEVAEPLIRAMDLLHTASSMSGEVGYQTGPVSTLRAKNYLRQVESALLADPEPEREEGR